MVKYFIGFGALVAVVVGYFLLSPAAIVSQDVAPVSAADALSLEDMAAVTRENLPVVVNDTLTLSDAVFLPSMRIMQYTYLTTAAAARDMRTLIVDQTDALCLEGRKAFEIDVIRRNSFEDSQGNVLARSYVLPEDCGQFYN
jgi:hypothetical protein